ncbi:hypothetical protein ACHAW6_007030 [Cyclotella cf. meneghiniana]
MFSPRLSHEKALKRIGRYLKAAQDKGLILNPCAELEVDAFPDDDFSGLYGYAKITCPEVVKSRTGYLITVCDCPVVWVSKLQTKSALSMMEAEIVALAHCCRDLFPIIDIVTEFGKVIGLPSKDLALMHVSVHEDNAGDLILAQTIPPEFTPQSKHYAIKTVWFREEIQKRSIKLLKIDRVEQLGDIFTKCLPHATFECLRKKMMGWCLIWINTSSRGSVDICHWEQMGITTCVIKISVPKGHNIGISVPKGHNISPLVLFVVLRFTLHAYLAKMHSTKKMRVKPIHLIQLMFIICVIINPKHQYSSTFFVCSTALSHQIPPALEHHKRLLAQTYWVPSVFIVISTQFHHLQLISFVSSDQSVCCL